MSDQERKDELNPEEYYEHKSTTDNNKSDSSSLPKTKGIKDKIVGKISGKRKRSIMLIYLNPLEYLTMLGQ